MKLVLVLRDDKAEIFMQPFFVATMGIAFRSLRDEIARGGEGNILSAHTGDFEIWEIGAYDEESGQILPVNPSPRFVCKLEQILMQSPGSSGPGQGVAAEQMTLLDPKRVN